MYYPFGNKVDIPNYRNVWNSVPDYKENHVYVMVRYDASMTDEELFEASRIRIEKLKKL
jgi:hypothetical protein